MLINDRKHLLNWKFCTNTHFISTYYIWVRGHTSRHNSNPLSYLLPFHVQKHHRTDRSIWEHTIFIAYNFASLPRGWLGKVVLLSCVSLLLFFFLLTMGMLLKVCEEIQGTIKKKLKASSSLWMCLSYMFVSR